MRQNEKGWSINITSKKATHYYKNGVSLCGKAQLQFFMDKLDDDINYSQVLGSVCSLCYKKLIKTK